MQSQEGKPQDTTPRPESSNQQPNGQKTALDFLRQKTAPNLQKQIDPVAIARQVKEQMEASTQDPAATPSPIPEKPIEEIVKEIPSVQPTVTNAPAPGSEVSPNTQAKADEQIPTEKVEGDEDIGSEETDIEDLIDPSLTAENKPSLRDSYKTLKTKYKETNDALKKERDEKEKWQRKSEAYETGTAIPQVLQEKENELQKLKSYKDLVDFKSSDEYEEKFAKPLEESKTKLKAISDELNVPIEEVLNASKGTEGQFNRFLSENFDIVSAMEVKNIVKGINELEGKKTEAETNPQKHLERLRQESARANEVKDLERKHAIQSSSKEAWVKTLNKIKADGKFTALIYSETDKDFNERVVKPLMTHAATEYAKTIHTLAERGIKDLDPQLAEAIALGHLLGSSSGVLAEAATKAMEEAEQIKSNTKNLFKFNRPSVGAGSPNGITPTSSEKPASSPLEAGKQITQKILAQRRS